MLQCCSAAVASVVQLQCPGPRRGFVRNLYNEGDDWTVSHLGSHLLHYTSTHCADDDVSIAWLVATLDTPHIGHHNQWPVAGSGVLAHYDAGVIRL